ncbi:hypothetical protein [Helicobacter fennelliae]|uniref:Uncharacterized protein n=1 Tax=Helicobacter fennelliae MRY12-0050 TaxID=1325130 RepID=T1DUQ5_9HELI|nr:hypothetical protein [Helicobacter fennelliae]GAD18103.1 hypothetical protein HFN_1701 [Helicobacter fennelliae MRY12-0050]
MRGQVCHCEDDRTKQSSQNGLPRLPSGSLAMTTKTIDSSRIYANTMAHKEILYF